MAKKKTGRESPRDSAPRTDLGEIARILAFMTEHGLDELEYQRGDFHVRLTRASGSQAAPIAGPAGSRPIHAASSEPAAAGATVSPETAPPPSPAENLHTVKSPIVGTFYAASAPGAPPFVKLGDVVKRGQVLCIVEAMKLMNEIEADQAGEVVRQLAENGQPVEYGQALFALRPLAEG